MDELQQRQKIISQLVEARLEQGISQAELARRVGTQRSNICRLESGAQNPTLDMILKIASALGKDVSLLLDDKEEPMSNIYSLRIYDTELMRFSMEKQGLSGLVAEILYTNEEQAHLLPLDMERTGEGVIRWLERRVIPKNRAFVDEILKTLGLSHNDTKGIIDVCKGLSLNDSYWVVPEGFEGKFSEYNLYENRFSEILALVAYTGAGGRRQAFTTSPELTTGGMLPKAWRYVEQDGITASKCELFTNIDTAYIPIGRIVRTGGIAACLAWYDKLGAEFSEQLRSMLVFDSLIYNEDRHFGNFGVLRDNHSGEIIAPAPIFDNGLSLFCYAGKEDYAHLDEYAKTRSNPYNISYEEVCAEVMGARQKEQLRRMIGFRFKRHESLNLPEEHLQAIEKHLESRVRKLLAIPTRRRKQDKVR